MLGEPLRILAARFSSLLRNLDFVEKCIFDIYLAGLLLYVIALPNLRLFDGRLILGLVSFSACVVIYHFRNVIKSWFSRNSFSEIHKRGDVIEQILVFAMFFVALAVQIGPLTSLVFGSIQDTSLHSLYVQVILENRYVPYNLLPYLPEGIVYPQAAHVIFASSAILTGWSAPLAVFYTTPLFNALTVFGAYFLAKKMWQSRYFHIGMVFVFTFVSAWPMYVTWGSNPFVVGLPLFLVLLGMFFKLVFNQESVDRSGLFLTGIMLGYLGAIIISFYQTLLALIFLLLLILVFLDFHRAARLFKTNVLIFAISIIPLAPLLYRFSLFYPYPNHNIGLPSDFMGYPTVQHWTLDMTGLQWTFANLTPYFFLSVEIIAIVVIGAVLFFKVKRNIDSQRAFSWTLMIFLASFLLSVLANNLPAEINVVSWGHQAILMAISFCPLVVLFNHHTVRFIQKSVGKIRSVNLRRPRVVLLSSLLLLAAVYSPFVYTRFFADPSTLRGSYQVFAVTTKDDENLMLWMKENLSTSAVILVNQYESGLFIPSLAQRKAIYATPGSQLSKSYQEVIGLLTNDTLDTTAYNLMKELGITHIYVGSQATYSYIADYRWDPRLFLGNPNLNLTKRIGNAFLFELAESPNSSAVFLDDFQHENWSDYGWSTYFEGNGLGNVTISNETENSSQSCMKMTAQAVYTGFQSEYTISVSREFFVPNGSDVSLSFYLDATTGFHANDTFAVLVSNVYHNQSFIIATPNGVYGDYAYSVPLAGFHGEFQFQENSSISRLWSSMFKYELPSTFLLEFINRDVDGIENVVYVGDVSITLNTA